MSDKKDDKKAVTTHGSTVADYFQRYGAAATQRSIIGSLLRFTKYGDYHYGQYDDELKHGTQLAAHMQTTLVGWQKWQGNRPVDAVMGLLAEGFEPPRRDKLGDLDQAQWETDEKKQPRDPWQFTTMLVLSDPRNNDLFTFSTSSKGGLNAIGELAKAYSNHLRVAPDEVPIVELQRGSYKHPVKEYGEIRFPILKPVNWIPTSQLPPLDGSAPEALAAPEEEPAPAPKPEQKAASPVRRKAKEEDDESF
jgi:hypothetical protein